MPSETAAPDREEQDITAITKRLIEIRARREALVFDRWHYEPTREAWPGVFYTAPDGWTFPLARLFDSGRPNEADSEGYFIAWAPDDIDFLLAEVQSLRTQLQEARQDRDGNSFAAEMELLQDEHDRLDPIVKLVVKKDYDRTGSEWVEVVNPWETLSALLDRRDSDHQAWLRSSTPLSE